MTTRALPFFPVSGFRVVGSRDENNYHCARAPAVFFPRLVIFRCGSIFKERREGGEDRRDGIYVGRPGAGV